MTRRIPGACAALPARTLLRLILLAALLLPWSATGKEVTGDDALTIRNVVQSQLEAFAADDATAAFGLATSSTRALLGSPEQFLQLIKEHYPPIYRHRGALFSQPEMIDGHVLLMVRLTAHDNVVWLAVYEMAQEEGGDWKIDGCNLFETTSVSI